MTKRTIDRIAIAAEATALEAAGADWNAKHLAAVLGCAVSTIYDTPWLRRIKRRTGVRGARWVPREVRNAQAIASSHPSARVG